MGSSGSKAMALALAEERFIEQEALRLARESILELDNTPIIPLSPPRPQSEQKPVEKIRGLVYPIPKEFRGSLSSVPEMYENIPSTTHVRRHTTPLDK